MRMNTLPAELKFSCSALSNYNGHDLKAAKPDENGCYEVVLGCVGAPTRANVIYEANSLVNAMRDPNSRFNLCLNQVKTTKVEVIYSSSELKIDIRNIEELKNIIDESFDFDDNKICFSDNGISMRDYFAKIKNIYFREEGIYLEGEHIYQ